VLLLLGAGAVAAAGRARDSAAAKLEILDSAGAVIRTFASATPEKPKAPSAALRRTVAPRTSGVAADTARARADSARAAAGDSAATGRTQPRDTLAEKPRGSRPFADDTLAFVPADSLVALRPGLNRFVWDLRYPSTREVKGTVNDEGTTLGPVAAPGRYTVRLTIGGERMTQPFVVRDDPRSRGTPEGLARQLALALDVQRKTNELSDAVERIVSIEDQLDARVKEAKGQPYAKQAGDAARALRTRLETVRDSLTDVHSHADQITLHYPVRYYNMLLSLADMVQSAEGEPPKQQFEVYQDLASKVDAQLARLRAIEATELAQFNKMLRDAGSGGVVLPGPSAAPVP
jgi:methyl-accepting chemotaxis protein